MPTDIVVDAMGSDRSPEPEVRGAVLAARQYDVRVHLVGPEDRLRPILRHTLRGQRLPVFIAPASEWITMDDKAAQAVRSKRDSTMRVGLKMVREGRAAGFFTAGNTGRRWLRSFLRSKVFLPCCSMWARMWTAIRITWSSLQ
jgi:phosphate acyltransferase